MILNYRFHKFTEDDGCKTDWTIVTNLISSTFLMNRCHLAIFPVMGKMPVLNNFLHIGMAINSLTYFIIGIGQPSGLGLRKLMILLQTTSGDSIESDIISVIID